FYEIQSEQWGVGTNALILTAYTAEGCSYSDSYIFEVADCSNILEFGSRPLMRLYPNPLQPGTALMFDDYMQHVNVRLFDASGRMVWAASDLEGVVIPLSAALSPGFYTMHAQSGAFHWTTTLMAE
ncbi:MAG: T9SS type A sorting domain-containing protein, partial [Flavobacteriales bacterium]